MLDPNTPKFDPDGFRLRGLGFSRLDAFSDVVFGFALTLLVVSLEVPKTYAELHDSLRGFVPFAISFGFLTLLWYAHYKFFRRYGLHERRTVMINAALLFFVLFYVYPLKFLFSMLTRGFLGGGPTVFQSWSQVTELMILFGVGFASVYLLIAALYANAYRVSEELALTPLELALTRDYYIESAGVGLIGLLSAAAAIFLPNGYQSLAGLVYLLIWPFRVLYTRVRHRHSRELATPPTPHVDPVRLDI